MAVHTAAQHSSSQVLPFRESLMAMLGISFVTMLVALDQTVVGTALPDHRRRTQGLRPVRVGRHLVSADLRHHRTHFRPPWRLLRTQTVRDCIDRRVHGGVRAVRPRQQHDVPRARARVAGHRRRHAGRHRVRLHRRPVPRQRRAPALAGPDEFGVRHRERDRAVARRVSHPVLRLAVGVLRESAGRRAVAVLRLALPAASSARRA